MESRLHGRILRLIFSAPIDPTNIRRDWGRSDDDQRHRIVINGTVNTSMAPAATAWQRITHGYQLSGMIQYGSDGKGIFGGRKVTRLVWRWLPSRGRSLSPQHGHPPAADPTPIPRSEASIAETRSVKSQEPS